MTVPFQKKPSALKSAIETIYIQEEMEKSQATIIVAFLYFE